MPSTKYTYPQSIQPSCLRRQISDSSIGVSLDYTSCDAASVDVWFADALSAGEQTTLDGLMSSHDLYVAKDQALQKLKNYRDYLTYLVPYTHTDTYIYDVGADSSFKMAATLAKINAGQSLPAGFTWEDASGTDRAFDDTSFRSFAEAIWSRANNFFVRYKTERDAISALATVEAVATYDFTSPAWP